jgi:hypothetical protein
MSYNNRPATDAIPFLSPILAPSARAVGPLLEQLATSPLRCVELVCSYIGGTMGARGLAKSVAINPGTCVARFDQSREQWMLFCVSQQQL